MALIISLRRQHRVKVKTEVTEYVELNFYAAPTCPCPPGSGPGPLTKSDTITTLAAVTEQGRTKIRFLSLLPATIYKLPYFNLRVLPCLDPAYLVAVEEHMNNNELEAAEKRLGVTTYLN